MAKPNVSSKSSVFKVFDTFIMQITAKKNDTNDTLQTFR